MQYKEHIQKHHAIGAKRIKDAALNALVSFKFHGWHLCDGTPQIKRFTRYHADSFGLKFGFQIALCHDLIEDTEVDEKILFDKLREIGYDIASADYICEGVKDLTDVFTSEAYPYLNRAIRKQCEALRLHSIPRNSQIIKCCDLIDNTKSIVEFDEGFARKYIPEKREIIKGFTKISGQIKSDVWNCLLDAEAKLNAPPIVGKICRGGFLPCI